MSPSRPFEVAGGKGTLQSSEFFCALFHSLRLEAYGIKWRAQSKGSQVRGMGEGGCLERGLIRAFYGVLKS